MRPCARNVNPIDNRRKGAEAFKVIVRNLAKKLEELAGYYPVVTVTGPRQSGKSTLCRATFPSKPYVSLEPLDTRSRALEDPRGFLAEHPDGAILDEVQHAPDLASYLQVEVDRDPRVGRFILTGSENFALSHAVSQSLAGRSGVLHLLPPSLDELRRFENAPRTLTETLWSGSYPRIHDQRIPADRWLADYVTTYVQRDVRQILNVTDLVTFTTFLRLCAGRSGQELHPAALGADAGVSHNTARAWLSVLEAGYICARLPAWHRNFRKRSIKAAKLHFLDSGLHCHLLGIRDPDELRHHPLRGAVFESWVHAEILKARLHAGLEPRLSHYREARGAEVDLLVEAARGVLLVEAKSGATVQSEHYRSAATLAAQLRDGRPASKAEAVLVYGGEEPQTRSDARVVPWSRVAEMPWD